MAPKKAITMSMCAFILRADTRLSEKNGHSIRGEQEWLQEEEKIVFQWKKNFRSLQSPGQLSSTNDH